MCRLANLNSFKLPRRKFSSALIEPEKKLADLRAFKAGE
jgi:hypothetical protein